MYIYIICVILYCITLHYILFYYTILYYIILCYVMLCYVMLCYVYYIVYLRRMVLLVRTDEASRWLQASHSLMKRLRDGGEGRGAMATKEAKEIVWGRRVKVLS